MLFWAIDAGGSSTTAITSTGARWVRGSINPISVGAAVAQDTLVAFCQDIALSAGGRPSVGWLATAACDPADARTELTRVARLARVAGLRGELVVSNDALPWLLAPPLHGRGVIAVCGTGSGFLACNGPNEPVRVGGCEYLGSDEGSAFHLGLAGLRAAVRAADGRGSPTTLGDRLAQRFTAPVQQLARTLASQPFPKPSVAKLAPVVCEAWLADDPVATAIVDAAVDELMLGMRAARDRAGLTGNWNAAAGGGVLCGCPPLFDTLARRVRTELGAHDVTLITQPASTVLAALHECLDNSQLTVPKGLDERSIAKIWLDGPSPAGALAVQSFSSSIESPIYWVPIAGTHGRKTDSIQLGLCLTAYDGSCLSDALASARALAVSIIDLPTDSSSRLIDLTRWGQDKDYRAALRGALGRSGLEVGCVSNSRDAQLLLGPHGPHTDPIFTGAAEDKAAHALRAALHTVELTADLGARQVRLMLGVPDFARWLSWWGSEVTWSENIAAWTQAVQPVLDAAAAHGVTLLLELHAKQVAYDRSSAEQTLAAASAASTTEVRLCIDPANQAAIGHDPVDAVRGWGPVLAAVHAKDLQYWRGRGVPPDSGWSRYGPGPAFRFRALGAGNLPWPDIVAALHDERFTGVLYLEYQDALLSREQGINASLRLLRELLP